MPDGSTVPPGERFADVDVWDGSRIEGRHLWQTLGYRRLSWEPGATSIAWQATEDYCFPSAGGPIVQGGLVTAILDAAMGGSCWTVLDRDQAFLTADLRVEFLRSAQPGPVTAHGWVIRRTRRVVFCAAELYVGEVARGDARPADLLATSRCTQVVLPASGRAGRQGPGSIDGAPPDDARG
ncbi:MAG TPA: PaaI family thioesterase [Mycobacteriales bacterium]|nr:PaaI family thioesterase [Mycobacteriales bacterium]